MARYLAQDLSRISQALSLLFEQQPAEFLPPFLGNYFSLLDGLSWEMDHVGRELYAPISFYLPLLKRRAEEWGLAYLGELIFPSVAVVQDLQNSDPNLKGVTVGRIYFQHVGKGFLRSLELFQAAPLDEKDPQSLQATTDRIHLRPIDHLAIRLNCEEEIMHLHSRIQQTASKTLQLAVQQISHNPGDGSIHTKAAIRSSEFSPFDRIIEFVYYINKMKWRTGDGLMVDNVRAL